jgi:hypothetical protein
MPRNWPELLSTTDIAILLGADAWKVRKPFDDGELQETMRVAGRRLIDRSMLPRIIEVLKGRGWLPETIDRNDSISSSDEPPEAVRRVLTQVDELLAIA